MRLVEILISVYERVGWSKSSLDVHVDFAAQIWVQKHQIILILLVPVMTTLGGKNHILPDNLSISFLIHLKHAHTH